ncbi:hypothetical protein GGF43_002221 [Coemansia sp. RSA 2618]|nr:hypothetical protein GGF43_002221 [Coemansia sp. RSA 2618]
MQPIYEKIVYTGQAKGKQFLGLARVESSPKVPEQMGDTLQIVDPVNGISTTRVPTSTSFASSAESTEPFLITGPRHVGKSHIMFHLAARLACDPGVVVVHIGNCRELLLDDSERDRFKYVKFVEHLVGAFGNYPFISAIADRWYVNTGMGTDALKMRDATNEFLSSLTQQCKSEDITLVFFLEHCEEFMYEAPFQVITSIGQLRHDYGAIVVMSSSNPVKLHFGEAMRWYQCIVSGPLNLVDAKNMCINSAKRLRMTSNELVTLLKSVEYHPLDAAGIVQAFENHFADGLKTTQDKKAHRQAAIEYAIADQRQVRRNRITEMHLWFLQQAMVSAAKRSDPKNIRRVGMTQSVIDTNSPELLADKREIMRCIFILFHAVELKPGAIRDIQFMLPENNANSSHEDSRDRAATVIPSYAAQCHPPVATDIIYNMYFRGTAKEQFGWLFDSNRYNVEARIRLRYFDMLFLEKGRLSGTVFSPLSTNSWDKNMSFVFVNCAFDAAGLKDVETRVCTKFSEALDVIQQYIESTKDLGPEYLPRVGQTRLENTIVFYFPRLGLEEEWMKQARPARHFQGSFMAAVTRIDMFSEHNREHLCGHTGCRFKITWISSDPIYVDKSKGEAAQRAQPARVKLAEDLVPEPVEDIPRDTVDFDGEFGSEHSWTAKVVQLFPEIRERTLDIGANSSLIDNVSLLALAAEQRFLNLLPANKRPLEKLVDLGKYSESINDIGIISTSEGCFSPEVKLRI